MARTIRFFRLQAPKTVAVPAKLSVEGFFYRKFATCSESRKVDLTFRNNILIINNLKNFAVLGVEPHARADFKDSRACTHADERHHCLAATPCGTAWNNVADKVAHGDIEHQRSVQAMALGTFQPVPGGQKRTTQLVHAPRWKPRNRYF